MQVLPIRSCSSGWLRCVATLLGLRERQPHGTDRVHDPGRTSDSGCYHVLLVRGWYCDGPRHNEQCLDDADACRRILGHDGPRLAECERELRHRLPVSDALALPAPHRTRPAKL
jgi:hypothetical protein